MQELDRAHFKVLEAMAMVTRTRRNVPFGSGTHERLKRVEAALGSVRQELEFEFHSLEQNGYGEKRVQGYAALQRAALAAEVRG